MHSIESLIGPIVHLTSLTWDCVTHQQHLEMGLRKGMAILVYYVVGDTKFQAVLLAHDSVVGRGGKGDN